MKKTESKTVWDKWQCGGGARWSSVHNSPMSEDLRGTVCNFSGCNCGTKVAHKGNAHSVEELEGWFRRPNKDKTKLIFSIPSDQLPFGIELRQKGHKNFTVIYGKEVKANLSYTEAATQFGLSLMHALNCEGKLD